MIITLPVTWEVSGRVQVEADSIAEAIEDFYEESDHIALPSDGDYVSGSFQLSTDDEDYIRSMQP